MNTCAVVILNWNGVNFLRKFLPGVLNYTRLPGVKVVVADNASTDDSVPVVRTEFPAVELICLDQNYGFAGGYNKALAQVDAAYYVLLNSDVEVTEGWLEPLLNYLESHPEVAALQPKIRAYNQPGYFEHAGASGGFIDSLGYPFCRGRILSDTEKDVNQYDTVADIFWATGACLVVRSEVYWACGGLDVDFFAHMEEIDLCWRMLSRGHLIKVFPASVVYHVGGGTLSAESPRKTYLNFRNNLLMLYKNLPSNRMKKVLWIRYFLDMLAAFHLAATGKFSNALAVIRARKDYHRMKNSFTARRNENLQFTVRTDLPGMYSGSILFAYYFKKIKKYSSLRLE